MNRSRLSSLMVCCFPALLLCACSSDPSQGYSFTAARDSSVRTIAVPVFDNKTFSHGLETQLTEAIVSEIQRTTRWAVVSGRGAQTTLSGTIVNSELRPISMSSSSGMILEQAVELTVDFEWRDAASGEVLIARKSFKSLQTFVPARGTGERLELGQHAAVQEMARNLVNELRSRW